MLVDNALSDSMLNPRVLKERSNDKDEKEKEVEADVENNLKKDEDIDKNMIEEADEIDNGNEKNEMTNKEVNVRKSSRIRKQRMKINDDEIRECDDEKDPDYTR